MATVGYPLGWPPAFRDGPTKGMANRAALVHTRDAGAIENRLWQREGKARHGRVITREHLWRRDLGVIPREHFLVRGGGMGG